MIAGGSGFLGRKLAQRLETDGHKAIQLSRRPPGAGNQIAWQPDGRAGALTRHFDGVDAVVNLAGEGIADKRWTAARKDALRNSRILDPGAGARRDRMRAPAEGVHQRIGDRLLRPARRRPVTESTPPATTFWRSSMGRGAQVESPPTRRRSSAPASRSSRRRALKKMCCLSKLGLGATMGSGINTCRGFMPPTGPHWCRG